jgi:glutamate--cysteine ligase
MIKEFLNDLIDKQFTEIEHWFTVNYAGLNPCIYNSVDIRYSGEKITPVDTNLFPAGFNNLNQEAMKKASLELKRYLAQYFPATSKILLIAESHSRNLYYLDNLVAIKNIVEQAGIEITIGSFSPEINNVTTLISKSETEIEIHELVSKRHVLQTKDGFIADLIVLNNDLTDGLPAIINYTLQPIIPDKELGWHKRLKSTHFTIYDQVARNFASSFNFDHFLITTMFRSCGRVNFKDKQGLECIAINIEKIMHNLTEKYLSYGIKDDPYVFVKSDKGTYGMGIMTARSGTEILEINKKNRNKMGAIKSGIINDEIIIQEGIRTIDKFKGHPAEQMIYLIGGRPVANIYRFNNMRDELGNLNAAGMGFDMSICQKEQSQLCKKYDAYGLIARLASLAAAKESNS